MFQLWFPCWTLAAGARQVADRGDGGVVAPDRVRVGRAFEWLDRAVDARDQFMMPIKSYAFLDPLRTDPRYIALLGKMNLDV